VIKQVRVDGVPYAEAAARARTSSGVIGAVGPGADGGRPGAGGPAQAARFDPASVPARDPQARPEWIDLGARYNASLTNAWMSGTPGDDLAQLPRGVATLDGVTFDVRGLVQLAGAVGPRSRFPRQVNGIPVGLACAQLHFLQGCGRTAWDGGRVANVIVHYADGQRATIPIVYGENVGDWRAPRPIANGTVAWTGTNRIGAVGLYRCVWANPRPAVEIARLDYASQLGAEAPFLVAITAQRAVAETAQATQAETSAPAAPAGTAARLAR
jgi:hypothetical protein